MAEVVRMRAAAALPLIASGVIAGVSLLAQPAKFLTHNLALADLVSVGSTLFSASHAFQLGMLLILALVVPAARARPAVAWALMATFALALGIQHFGLMPLFKVRLLQLRHGHELAPSMLHLVYATLELVKLASLLMLAWLPGATARRPYWPGVTA